MLTSAPVQSTCTQKRKEKRLRRGGFATFACPNFLLPTQVILHRHFSVSQRKPIPTTMRCGRVVAGDAFHSSPSLSFILLLGCHRVKHRLPTPDNGAASFRPPLFQVSSLAVSVSRTLALWPIWLFCRYLKLPTWWHLPGCFGRSSSCFGARGRLFCSALLCPS